MIDCYILMCVQVLIDWINSELEEERIIVKDLEEDCYDGQVLQKLFGEKLVSLASQLSQYIYPYISFCLQQPSLNNQRY